MLLINQKKVTRIPDTPKYEEQSTVIKGNPNYLGQ